MIAEVTGGKRIVLRLRVPASTIETTQRKKKREKNRSLHKITSCYQEIIRKRGTWSRMSIRTTYQEVLDRGQDIGEK